MKILESLKHLAWHCIFTCNNKLKWYIILLLWIPYFLILGMFCFYAFYLLVPLSAFIFSGGFLGKIPPIDGKAALDQTSVVEFMLYGAVLQFGSFLYGIIMHIKTDFKSTASKLSLLSPMLVSFVSSLIFWLSSFFLLLPIISKMGWTYPRVAGLICAAFFTCFLIVQSIVVICTTSVLTWITLWLTGFITLNIFMLNGGVCVADGYFPHFYISAIIICGILLLNKNIVNFIKRT